MATAAALGAGALGYGWRIEPHWIELVERDMPIEGLPGALHGRTLVQISDLHVGPLVDDGYLARAFERVRSLSPDFIAVTGDIMTCVDTEEVDHTSRVFRQLPRARHGTIAILGNHDYGRGWNQRHVADALADRLTRDGLIVLRNQRYDARGLAFVGLDDFYSPQWNPQLGLGTLRRDDPRVVLCHNPDAVDYSGWRDYRGWILSGHTHGGQVRAPIVGPLVLPVVNRRYAAGDVDLGDGRRMYVNRALGYHRRFRFNARPEITRFTLRAV